ncbi:MAG: alanine racemase [Dehalococcoidia bacterium]|nr:alanine racemase [Dehalococcoidia bacterium]
MSTEQLQPYSDDRYSGVRWRGRPLWASISLDALRHNIHQIKKHIGPKAEILAVVKANGYGHGAIPIARAALSAGANGLAVACTDEGVQLREAGITAPILVMGYTPAWETGNIVLNDLIPTVSTSQLADSLASAAQSSGKVLPVHLKIDTGMSRFGVTPAEARDLALLISRLPSIELAGIYTHFAAADEADKSFTQQQFSRFLDATRNLPQVRFRHAANSAAIADLPEMALDMVRPGISIYGCYPSKMVGRSLDLRPVLSLRSYVTRVLQLSRGDSVSYGRTWVAERDCRVALVSCGYADGLPRLLSNRGNVLIRGERAAIVGRICMDQCLADVSHIEEAQPEDEVVIIGKQGDEEISVEDIAEQAQTISYEILCGISARVPRVYTQDGQVVTVTTLVNPQTIR